MNQGAVLESRVQRLLFWEGYFARTSVSLTDYFHPERVDVTDLDVIALDLSRLTRLPIIIAECKSGAAKMPDRLLWLRGLQHYFHADAAMFVAPQIPTKIKEFAQALDLNATSLDRLQEREEAASITADDWFGPFDPDYKNRLLGSIRTQLKEEREFQRMYWFLTADYWHTDKFIRIKRLLNALNFLSERWVERVENPRSHAYRWVLGEATTLLSLALVQVAAEVHAMTEAEARDFIWLRMASGVARFDELQRLTRRVNEYVQATVFEALGAEALARVPSFDMRPPEYTEALVDIVMRMRPAARAALDAPRYLDLLVYGRWLRGQTEGEAGIGRFKFDIPSVERQVENLRHLIMRATKIERWHFERLAQAGPVPLARREETRPAPPTHRQESQRPARRKTKRDFGAKRQLELEQTIPDRGSAPEPNTHAGASADTKADGGPALPPNSPRDVVQVADNESRPTATADTEAGDRAPGTLEDKRSGRGQ